MLPNKLHRNKEKTFTTKRDNYKNYTKAPWIWNNKQTTHLIAKKYNIKYSTLTRKYKRWINTGNDENKYLTNIENRGGYNKIFTENEEKELSLFIKNLYIKN